MITKAREIEILRNAVHDLGCDSYCGVWLASILDEVKREVQSDFTPLFTIAEHKKTLAQLEQSALKTANDLIDEANKRASAIMSEASDRATREVDSACDALRSSLRRLQS